MRALIHAADQNEPIELDARLIEETAKGLPLVEYQLPQFVEAGPMPTLLCFGGGGCSGVIFALLAKTCAARGIRLVSFDMPGHTPDGLLGQATPPHSLISRADSAVRRAASAAMVERWRKKSTSLDALSHSAGIVDVARLPSKLKDAIGHFLITGAGIPGMAAMKTAKAASDKFGPPEPMSLWTLLKTRQIATGHIEVHLGPQSSRTTPDAVLERYQSPEHISVALALLSPSVVEKQDWLGRNIVLIGSDGDTISPPERLREAEPRLRARGAAVRLEIMPVSLPHLFMCFAPAAQRMAEIAGQCRATEAG
jgi:pimeloyl-ACP methyl ester carboxylesterase